MIPRETFTFYPELVARIDTSVPRVSALFLFFILSRLTYSQEILSKTIDFEIEEVPLEEALLLFEEKSGVAVAFSKSQIPSKFLITVKKKVSARKIIDEMCVLADLEYEYIGQSIVIRARIPEYLTISGVIMDRTGLEPLAYASLGLIDEPIGTITNSQGAFDLHLPLERKSDTIMASMMGYSAELKTAEQWSRIDTIWLEQRTLLLDSIMVVDRVPPAEEIIDNAFYNLYQNYPTKVATMEGFYRNYFSVDDRYVSLLEAAVVIEGASIKRKFKKDKVFIREIRSNHGLDRTNSLFRESKENFLGTLLVHDMVRYGAQKRNYAGSIFDQSTHEYIVDSVTTMNGRPVYVLVNQSYPSDYSPYMTPFVNARLKLFIDSESYAIWRIERISDFDGGQSPWRLGGHEEQSYDMTFNRFVQEYKLVDGQMQLNYFSSMFRFQVKNTQTGNVKWEEALTRELMINQVEAGKQNEFNWHEEMTKNKNLEATTASYNQPFWDSYNMIKTTPLNDQILRDLEQNQALESQFQVDN